jgi:hypothetical protein
MGWSGVVGTGLVIGQKDGVWTSPSAISLAGVGWGLQLGGSVSDILVVLRNRYNDSPLMWGVILEMFLASCCTLEPNTSYLCCSGPHFEVEGPARRGGGVPPPPLPPWG